MAYTTIAELKTRYGAEIDQLMDRNNDNVTDEAIALRAINDAEALIDGRLATRYQVPVDPAPDALGVIASDIARFFLWDDRVPEAVQRRYEEAVSYLRDIATGKAELATTAGGEIESDALTTGAIFRRGREPLNLEGYTRGG